MRWCHCFCPYPEKNEADNSFLLKSKKSDTVVAKKRKGRTAGLIYGRPYVSQVQKIIKFRIPGGARVTENCKIGPGPAHLGVSTALCDSLPHSKHLAHTRLIAGAGPDPRLSSSSHRSTPSPASPRPPPSSRCDGAKSPRLSRLVPPVILHG